MVSFSLNNYRLIAMRILKVLKMAMIKFNVSFETIIPSVLKKCFDGFCVDGAIHVDTIGTILSMMGLRVKPSALKEIVKEIDADGSG